MSAACEDACVINNMMFKAYCEKWENAIVDSLLYSRQKSVLKKRTKYYYQFNRMYDNIRLYIIIHYSAVFSPASWGEDMVC